MKWLRATLKRIPFVRSVAAKVFATVTDVLFNGTVEYWERRYSEGGCSGNGSYGPLAEFKAEVVNTFVTEHQINSIIEFGSGDGNQLSLAKYPTYVGLDVSQTAIRSCMDRYNDDATKIFFIYVPDCFADRGALYSAELALSLDVIRHLIEDRLFVLYMTHLFSSAKRFVIIYSSDTSSGGSGGSPHFMNRKFSTWVERNLPEWRLYRKIPNRYPWPEIPTGSCSSFFIYEKVRSAVADPDQQC